MIAIDVMGGDRAPDVVLQGSLQAASKAIPITLFGPSDAITQWLDKHDKNWKTYPITIVHAPEVVAMDDDPLSAIRQKRASSLVVAIESVATGRCRAVVSAGNSGALMAAAIFIIGREDAVERAPFAGFLPTPIGSVLCLDLGANTDCRAHHLMQFAHLGNSFVKKVLGLPRPRIGLLSNGHEQGKGSMLVKEAYALLKKENSLHFIGNVEPCHIFSQQTDVVVCDGFSGNVMLKTLESTITAMQNTIEQEGAQYGIDGLKLANAITSRFSSNKDGGALLLGVKGTVVVCHGASTAHDIEKAIIFSMQSNTIINAKRQMSFQREMHVPI
jgi:glycerol-3-phosphate acyltransferase PlsX